MKYLKNLSLYKKISLSATTLFLLCFTVLAIMSLQVKQEKAITVLDQPQQMLSFDFRKKTHFDDPKPLPDLSFLDPEGNKVTWDDFKGKYTLINIWATWCSPCVVELPTLEELGRVFKDRELQVIAVSIDMVGNQERLKTFLDKRKIGDFALYFDADKVIQKNIPMRGIPTTFLLNPDGKLVYIFEGEANWSAPPAVDFFDTLLKANY